jgi:hypothetical protein
VDKVIREDFFGSPEFVGAYNSSTREESTGSYYGSPEHHRIRAAFDAARVDRGGGFDDKHTGHYELLTDAGQPWNSVQHSTNLGALRCSSLDPFLKCQSMNMHPIFIVPGPKQPANQRPYLLRSTSVFQKYGLSTEGIPLTAITSAQNDEIQEDNQATFQHHRIVLTGEISKDLESTCKS